MHRLFTALGAPFFAGALLLSLIAAPSPAVSAPVAKPANYDHPIRDPGTTNHFTVTVCDSGAPGWVWKNPYNIKGPGEVSITNSGSGQHGGVRSNGTDGSVEIIGNSVGENTVEFDITQDSDGATVHVTLKIVVIACGSSTAAGGNGAGNVAQPKGGGGPGPGQRAAANLNANRGGGGGGGPPPPVPFPGGGGNGGGNGGGGNGGGNGGGGGGPPPDFKNPQPDGVDEYTVTVCDTGAPGWVWKNPYGVEGPATVNNFDQGSGHHGAVRSHGTDGSVEVIGNSTGDNTVSFNITRDSDGKSVRVRLHIHVIDCSPPKRHRGGFFDHVTIGIGVDVGGGDDHEDHPHHHHQGEGE